MFSICLFNVTPKNEVSPRQVFESLTNPNLEEDHHLLRGPIWPVHGNQKNVRKAGNGFLHKIHLIPHKFSSQISERQKAETRCTQTKITLQTTACHWLEEGPQQISQETIIAFDARFLNLSVNRSVRCTFKASQGEVRGETSEFAAKRAIFAHLLRNRSYNPRCKELKTHTRYYDIINVRY